MTCTAPGEARKWVRGGCVFVGVSEVRTTSVALTC